MELNTTWSIILMTTIFVSVFSVILNVKFHKIIKAKENLIKKLIHNKQDFQGQLVVTQQILEQKNCALEDLQKQLEDLKNQNSFEYLKTDFVNSLNNIVKDVNDKTKPNKIKKNIINVIRKFENTTETSNKE